MIVVINRLAFLAEVRGAIGAIVPRSLSSIADGSVGRISRCDHDPDEKDINEYFLSQKKSSELKFVLKVAVTFY